jgi:hypothetical protein
LSPAFGACVTGEEGARAEGGPDEGSAAAGLALLVVTRKNRRDAAAWTLARRTVIDLD